MTSDPHTRADTSEPVHKLACTPLRFAGAQFQLYNTGALYWPAQGTLIVSDMHFGKAERIARRGGPLLPPFGDLDTLARLDATLFVTRPDRVISLGDAFDDDAAGHALPAAIRNRLHAIADATDWIWITGNHDPGAPDLPGRSLPQLHESGFTFRHIAEQGPDISGHYHPKVALAGRTLRAALLGRDHLILPAFGSYTGGLPSTHPALKTLTAPGVAYALGPKILRVPLRT
ncbi:ligase-associated DNA damage response endonuclease PdeM [Rhodobacteraceae bacterium]|nr:ligase-associated DNA damage response endonuclease PdeM [Paracoccaceae bacterium]